MAWKSLFSIPGLKKSAFSYSDLDTARKQQLDEDGLETKNSHYIHTRFAKSKWSGLTLSIVAVLTLLAASVNVLIMHEESFRSLIIPAEVLDDHIAEQHAAIQAGQPKDPYRIYQFCKPGIITVENMAQPVLTAPLDVYRCQSACPVFWTSSELLASGFRQECLAKKQYYSNVKAKSMAPSFIHLVSSLLLCLVAVVELCLVMEERQLGSLPSSKVVAYLAVGYMVCIILNTSAGSLALVYEKKIQNALFRCASYNVMSVQQGSNNHFGLNFAYIVLVATSAITLLNKRTAKSGSGGSAAASRLHSLAASRSHSSAPSISELAQLTALQDGEKPVSEFVAGSVREF